MNPQGEQHVSGSAVLTADCPDRGATASKNTDRGPFEAWLHPGWLARARTTFNDTSVLSVRDTSVLLVCDEESCLSSLGAVLRDHLLVEVTGARNCQEVSHTLTCGPIPHLILTDTKLADGSWEDILDLATAVAQPVNVFIVSRIGNIGLYREAMSRGAFDFITPNIPPAAFVQALNDATEDICLRRQLIVSV
jgi:ActR/RegA family two-component response regulator